MIGSCISCDKGCTASDTPISELHQQFFPLLLSEMFGESKRSCSCSAVVNHTGFTHLGKPFKNKHRQSLCAYFAKKRINKLAVQLTDYSTHYAFLGKAIIPEKTAFSKGLATL